MRVEGGRREVADAKDRIYAWSGACGCVPFLLVGVMLRRAESLPEGRVLEPRHILVVGFLLLALMLELRVLELVVECKAVCCVDAWFGKSGGWLVFVVSSDELSCGVEIKVRKQTEAARKASCRL